MQCMWVGACRWAFVMLGKGLRAQIAGPALYSAAQQALRRSGVPSMPLRLSTHFGLVLGLVAGHAVEQLLNVLPLNWAQPTIV